MQLIVPAPSSPPDTFPNWQFETLDVEYHRPTASVWMYYKEQAPPHYTFQTLLDMVSVRASLQRFFESDHLGANPIRYFVMGSHKPGVFKLGGDLASFADKIRRGDETGLKQYAYACIDVISGLTRALDLPIVTLGVIGGQALGGGLEAALAMDYVIAEETARLGVPEVSFNSFPGMGAISLLSRRLSPAKAGSIIASGTVYSAREMWLLGVVDYLSPPQRGTESALEWMARGGERQFQKRLTLTKARRKLFPLATDELTKITDLWVECCMGISDADLRHMDRLVSAQRRKAA